MKPLLINYSSKGREDYHKGALRLADSFLNLNLDWDIRLYSPDMPIDEYRGIPIRRDLVTPHNQTPYRFKLDLIEKALEDGYKQIIWCDSSIIIHKNPIELLGESPLVFFDNLGHPLYKYISDYAMDCLDVSNIYDIPQTWGGCFMLDFNNQKTSTFFTGLCKLADMGAFNDGLSKREGFIAHRHDQSIMSALLFKNKIKLLPYGKIVCSIHANEPYEYGKDFYFIYK